MSGISLDLIPRDIDFGLSLGRYSFGVVDMVVKLVVVVFDAMAAAVVGDVSDISVTSFSSPLSP